VGRAPRGKTGRGLAVSPITVSSTLSFHFSDGEERQWLRIENHDPRTKDFHPSLTNIVCDYKPIVRKLGPNKYEITFVSEIAEDLP
jgi:sugar phosphate isomerase/epimerase